MIKYVTNQATGKPDAVYIPDPTITVEAVNLTATDTWRTLAHTNIVSVTRLGSRHPDGTVRPYSPTLYPNVVFEPDVDYKIDYDLGRIMLIDNALTQKFLYQNTNPPGTAHLQTTIWITYSYDNAEIKTSTAANIDTLLDKIVNGSSLEIAAFGDSTTMATTADLELEQHAWIVQVPEQLKKLWPNLTTVNYHNMGIGGTLSTDISSDSWIESKLVEFGIDGTPQDLFFLNYGMNDQYFGTTDTDFEANLRNAIDYIRNGKGWTDCAFILISGLYGNYDDGFYDAAAKARFYSYRVKMQAIAADTVGVAVADVTTPWEKYRLRKADEELLGNGINHPNSWSVGIYTNTIMSLLPRYGVPGAETQETILSKVATATDGAILNMKQGQTEAATATKVRINDSSNNIVFAARADGRVTARHITLNPSSGGAVITLSGATVDSSSSAMILTPTHKTGTSGSIYSNMQGKVVPTADIVNYFGQLNLPSLDKADDGNSYNIATMNGSATMVSTNADYTGTLGEVMTHRIMNPVLLGVATIGDLYGLYVEDLVTLVTGNKYAVYTAGDQDSSFGGVVESRAGGFQFPDDTIMTTIPLKSATLVGNDFIQNQQNWNLYTVASGTIAYLFNGTTGGFLVHNNTGSNFTITKNTSATINGGASYVCVPGSYTFFYATDTDTWKTINLVLTVTSANADIAVSATTSTPVLTLNSSTTGGADKIAKYDSSGALVVDVNGNAVVPVTMKAQHNSATNRLDFQTARTSGAAMTSGTRLAAIGILGAVATNTYDTARAIWAAQPSETWSNAAGGTTGGFYQVFYTRTPQTGQSSMNGVTERMRLTETGSLRVGPDATNNATISAAGRLSYAGTGRKSWTKYTANTVTLTAGTSTSTVTDLQTMADGTFYNITEAAAAPGMDLIVDFINVTAFEVVRILGAYNGQAGHAVAIQLYNWSSAAWNTFNAMQNDTSDTTTAGGYILGNYQFTVFDDTSYIGTGGDAGKVRVRFYHTMTGNASHDMHLDEVSLRQ